MATNPPNPARAATKAASAIFQITSAKLYVPVVTLSIKDNFNFLKDIKQGLKRRISWNRYRCEIITKPKNNNLNHMIDSIFRSINMWFVFSIKNGNKDHKINYFDKHCMPLLGNQDFNEIIDNKLFFDELVKNKQEAYEKLVKNFKK